MGMTKVLSANDVKRIAGISGKQYKRVQWHSAEVIVRPFLTIEECMETVSKIMDNSRDPEGRIVPELIDFSIRINLLAAYASVELPEDAKELYYAVYASDLYDTVIAAVNKGQTEEIIRAVFAHVMMEAGNGR